MQVKVAIIGGTGVGSRLAQIGGSAIHVPTRAGLLRGRLLEMAEGPCVVVQRHSAGHRNPPHRVEYDAIALGLAKLGVRYTIASAAVGCLRADWKPGDFAICEDFIDFSGRNKTLFDHSVVHTDMTKAYSEPIIEALKQACQHHNEDPHRGAIYGNANGPRYESPAEIQMMRTAGADIVGMTSASEAIAINEARVGYGCIAIVTNMAAGMDGTTLSHGEVEAMMELRGQKAVDVLLTTAAILMS